ncbi:MAG TPA: hypothetical protein VGB82_03695 [Alphaproteobacteria bacterium]
MSPFYKTLFGDAATIAVTAIVMVTEVVLVAADQAAWAAVVVPAVVLAGTAWLARR